MASFSYEGAHTAIITPLRYDGHVDWTGLEKNLEFQVDQGITGILAVGTTGESPTLDWREHNGVIDKAIDVGRGKCLVVAGTGSNSTDEALEATRHAAHSGADAVLLVDCYYNGPSSLELRREYHGAIAKACPGVDVIPYIIPGRTGCAMSPEDLVILAAECMNVRAVKEATGDLERMKLTRQLAGDSLAILSGDDDITFTIMTDPAIAAAGVISVVSNVAPAAVARMVTACLNGDTEEAERVREGLSPLFGIVTVTIEQERQMPNGSTRTVKDKFRNPAAIKTLMNGLGMPAGPMRPPMGRMTAAGVDAVRSAARTVWHNHPEILRPIADAFGVDIGGRIGNDSVWEALSY
ncbi:MAG: 4-hydroxy-tetrahydrodipicolinate synthase [Planctomycetes bacterium]|nr:4-hydroxy-tetrahydrodipicolinate synthase [Planctomycetota bacterium]